MFSSYVVSQLYRGVAGFKIISNSLICLLVVTLSLDCVDAFLVRLDTDLHSPDPNQMIRARIEQIFSHANDVTSLRYRNFDDDNTQQRLTLVENVVLPNLSLLKNLPNRIVASETKSQNKSLSSARFHPCLTLPLDPVADSKDLDETKKKRDALNLYMESINRRYKRLYNEGSPHPSVVTSSASKANSVWNWLMRSESFNQVDEERKKQDALFVFSLAGSASKSLLAKCPLLVTEMKQHQSFYNDASTKRSRMNSLDMVSMTTSRVATIQPIKEYCNTASYAMNGFKHLFNKHVYRLMIYISRQTILVVTSIITALILGPNYFYAFR